MDKNYWEQYYMKNKVPTSPSDFAIFCAKYLKEGRKLVELGCGNGRDSVFFSKKIGLSVYAIDQCETEISFLNKEYGSANLTFIYDDFTNLDKNDVLLDYVYSRFTLHSIEESKENSTIKWAYDNMKPEGLFMLELRSIKDDLCGSGTKIDENAYVTDHYRRFAEYDKLLKKILEIGFSIEYSIEDSGLAKYKKEDPVVIRIIAKK